ncbi:MAG: flagellar export protein FliJ [Chloroflexota bacterium]
MKGFHFRLDPVLTLRRHKEESLQVQLARSQRALEAEVGRLEALRWELKSQAVRLASQQTRGPLDMDQLNRGSAYLAGLESRIEGQSEAVESHRRQVEQDREAVLQASREKKAMEKLREALLIAFAREEVRKEQKGAEEMATTRYVRRQQGRELV